MLESKGWHEGDTNVFLDPPGLAPITLSRIQLDGNKADICVPVIQGRIAIRLEGRGERTLISRVT